MASSGPLAVRVERTPVRLPNAHARGEARGDDHRMRTARTRPATHASSRSASRHHRAGPRSRSTPAARAASDHHAAAAAASGDALAAAAGASGRPAAQPPASASAAASVVTTTIPPAAALPSSSNGSSSAQDKSGQHAPAGGPPAAQAQPAPSTAPPPLSPPSATPPAPRAAAPAPSRSAAPPPPAASPGPPVQGSSAPAPPAMRAPLRPPLNPSPPRARGSPLPITSTAAAAATTASPRLSPRATRRSPSLQPRSGSGSPTAGRPAASPAGLRAPTPSSGRKTPARAAPISLPGLTRLADSGSAAAASAAAGKPPSPSGSRTSGAAHTPSGDWLQYIRPDERTRFSVEQLRFLARKRRWQAGQGPPMPEESTCSGCGGTGMTICHQCRGTGVNERDMEEIMQNSMENIVAGNNGVVNVMWFLQKGGPCWYCRGDPRCPCRSCEGTGIANFRSTMWSGD